jgi:hypothetical protein
MQQKQRRGIHIRNTAGIAPRRSNNYRKQTNRNRSQQAYNSITPLLSNSATEALSTYLQDTLSKTQTFTILLPAATIICGMASAGQIFFSGQGDCTGSGSNQSPGPEGLSCRQLGGSAKANSIDDGCSCKFKSTLLLALGILSLMFIATNSFYSLC